MQVIESFPMILKAYLEMEGCNGGLHRDRDREAMLRGTDAVIGADGVDWDDLFTIDVWLSTLTDDELLTFVDGEDTEIEELVSQCEAGRMAHGLFNDLFEAKDAE